MDQVGSHETIAVLLYVLSYCNEIRKAFHDPGIGTPHEDRPGTSNREPRTENLSSQKFPALRSQQG